MLPRLIRGGAMELLAATNFWTSFTLDTTKGVPFVGAGNPGPGGADARRIVVYGLPRRAGR